MIKAFAIRCVGTGLLAAMLLSTAAIADSKWVKPGDIDIKAILPSTAPSNDSDQTRQEIAQILVQQAQREQLDVDRCKKEETYNVFAFTDTMGSWFTSSNVPLTAALMSQVNDDAEPIINAAQSHYGRPRPFLLDSHIVPCVAQDKSGAYPSGHAAHAFLDAAILTQIMPDKEDRLKIRAQQIADDRVMGGVQFPSDGDAGKQLGQAMSNNFLNNPDFMAELEKAKAECATHYRER